MAIDLKNTPAYSTPAYKSQWGFDEFWFTNTGKDLKLNVKADDVNSDGFGQNYKNHNAGMAEAKADVKGLWNGNPNGLAWVVNQRFGRKTPVNYWQCHDDLLFGRAITGMPSVIMDRSINAGMKDSTEVDMSFGGKGAVDEGFIIVSPNATTQLATTGIGSVNDNTLTGGATPNGGAAYLWIWAIDGGSSPTLALKIQHSSDAGVTWVDLATFTTVTGLPTSGTWSQRLPISSTVTINAQVRANWVTTGAPTGIQGMVMYSRTPDRSA